MNRFRARRDEMDKTQRQIAESFTPQITPAAVSAWENDVASPESKQWEQVAAAYKKSVEWVMAGVREIEAAKRLAAAR